MSSAALSFTASLKELSGLCHQYLPLSGLQGISLYHKPRGTNDAVIVATQFAMSADPDYQAFYKQHIRNKIIPLAGTAVGSLLQSEQSSNYQRSSYRSDQYCYNFLLGQNAAGASLISQMVFRADANFRSPLNRDDLLSLAKLAQFSGLGNSKLLMDDNVASGPQALRSAWGLYWDISGYKQIVRQYGAQAAQDFTWQIHDQLWQPIQNKYGCDMLRSEGDGVWLSYPVTGFLQKEKQEYFEHFMQSAQDMLGIYNAIRQKSALDKIRASAAKIALIGESGLEVMAQNSRISPYVLDGPVFLRGRQLMQYAPRDRDVIILDPDFHDGLFKADDWISSGVDVLTPTL